MNNKYQQFIKLLAIALLILPILIGALTPTIASNKLLIVGPEAEARALEILDKQSPREGFVSLPRQDVRTLTLYSKQLRYERTTFATLAAIFAGAVLVSGALLLLLINLFERSTQQGGGEERR